MIQPTYTSNIVVEHITLLNPQAWTLHLAWTDNVYINNITVISPPGTNESEWLETDGIDVDCSVNVTIENVYISTGRDSPIPIAR